MLYPISVPVPNSEDNLFGYINSRGIVVIPPSYAGCSHFSEGKAAVINRDGRSEFIDFSGAPAIPFIFGGLASFHEGLCQISGGYINHNGDWLIEPQFPIASPFSGGLAFASTNGEFFGFIDSKGKFVVRSAYSRCRSFSEGLAAVCVDEHWGYIDRAGELRIPSVFEKKRATGFSFGLAGVQKDGRCGFIDPKGSFVIEPKYEDVRPFVEGRACVQLNGRWGFVDTEGDEIVPCKFEEFSRFNGGMAPARIDGKAGFISEEGDWLIEPSFDRCYGFYCDLAVVRQGRTYSYVRRNGQIVWTSQPGARVQYPPPPVLI